MSNKYSYVNVYGILTREEIEILEENKRMIEENPTMKLTQEATTIRLAYYKSGSKKKKKERKTPKSQPR